MYWLKKVSTFFLLSVFILSVGLSCQSDEKMVLFEKERIEYMEKVQSAVDRLDMKIAELRRLAEQNEMGNKDLQEVITDLELLEERFNRKLGELDEVTLGDWKRTRSEIDQMMIEMGERLKQAEQIRQNMES